MNFISELKDFDPTDFELMKSNIDRFLENNPDYVLRNICKLKKNPVYLLTKKELDVDKKNVMIVSGFHGEEHAGPWGVIEYLNDVSCKSQLNKMNVSFMPCVNVHGFKNNTRLDHKRTNANRHYIINTETMVKNSTAHTLYKNIDNIYNLSKDGMITMHEDTESKAFYVWLTSHDIKAHMRIAKDILKCGSNVFMTYKKPTNTPNDGDDNAKVMLNQEDGSFEHKLYTMGVPICVTSETPLIKGRLVERITVNCMIIRKFLDGVHEL